LIALVTVAAAVGSLRIRMEFSQRSLLPSGYPSVRTIEEVEETFGGIQFTRVLLEGTDFTSPEGVLALYNYERELREEGEWDGYVLRVDTFLGPLARNPQGGLLLRLLDDFHSPLSDEELRDRVEEALLSPEASDLAENPGAEVLMEALQRFVRDPAGERAAAALVLDAAVEEAVDVYLKGPAGVFAVGKLITPDGGRSMVTLQVRPDLPQAEAMEKAAGLRDYTRDFFAAEGIDAEVSGEVYVMADIQEMAVRDSLILGMFALAFIFIVLFLTFRRVLDVLLTLGVVVVSMLWVFGLMGYVGIPYTIMSIAIVPLLLGIDIAYAIHLLTRYYEEERKGGTALESSVGAVSTVGVAVFLTAATTMFGFLSFLISDLPPMREFGVLCLAGVFFSFLLSVTLLPAALVIRDRRKAEGLPPRERHRLAELVDRALLGLSGLAERHRRPVGLLVLAMVAAGAILATGLSTSADFRAFVPQDLPSYRTITRMEENFGGLDTAVALVEGENVLRPEVLRSVEEFIQRVLDDPRNREDDGDYRYFRPDRVTSLPTLFLAVRGSLPSTEEEAAAVLEEAAEAYGFDTASLLSADGKATLAVFDVLFVDEAGEREMASILRDQAEGMSVPGLSFRVTGTPLIVSDTMGKLFSTQLETGALALVLCTILVIVVFRSVLYGLAAGSVVFLAIILELGILRLIGWPLDIMTVMIASLVIGAGIDFGIHVAHRFREEMYERGLSPEEAVNVTVRNVGTALVSAALTTCGAFLILALSSLSPLRRFGVITAVALACALFAALVLEPTLLASIALHKKRKGA
jgi:hypothetical protein